MKERAANSKTRTHRVLFIQQYFYPDISAVSQLLGDLVTWLSKVSGLELSVLCSRVHRTVSPSLGEFEAARIYRTSWSIFGDTTAAGQIVHMATFHVGVFFHLLFSRRYDTVVCMTTPPFIGFTASLALRLRPSKRLVYYVQDLYPEILFDTGIIRKSYLVRKTALFNRVTLHRADAVVVLGDYMTRKLRYNYELSEGRATVIENWTNLVEYHEPPARGPFVILYSGNLGFAHDFRLLPLLIHRLLEVNVSYRFVGGGRKFGDIRRVFTSNHERRVVFDSYVDRAEHDSVLADASMFLVAQSAATVGDLLPSKIYSYLAAGRPILFLGPSRSEIGEVILREQIGVVMELEEDVAPGAARIKAYLDDRTEYLETCLRARHYYESHLGLGRSAERLRGVLASIEQALPHETT